MKRHVACLGHLALSSALLAASGSAQVLHAHGRAVSIATPENHPHFFQSLQSAGYRLISIDVWGPYDLGTVTAVWELAPGPAWTSYHFLKPAKYQAVSDDWVSQGFSPMRVSSAGRHEDRYACVFENNGIPAFSKHGQTVDELAQTMRYARENNYMLESIAVEGSPVRFATTWLLNIDKVDWQIAAGDSAAYQNHFVTLAGFGYAPHFVTVEKDAVRYWAIMRRGVGYDYAWSAYHGIALTQHDQKMAELKKAGYKPRHIARGGYTNAGVWQKDKEQ